MNLGEWRLSSYRFTRGGCRVRDGDVGRLKRRAQVPPLPLRNLESGASREAWIVERCVDNLIG
jgi:hypothetical protein